VTVPAPGSVAASTVSVAASVAPEVVVDVVSVAAEAVSVAVPVAPEAVSVAVSVAPDGVIEVVSVVLEPVGSCPEALGEKTANMAPNAMRMAASRRHLERGPSRLLSASDGNYHPTCVWLV
jgi:hypothetical protein